MTNGAALSGLSTRAVVVDDGVVAPLHGETACRDDVVASNAFGPVLE